MSKILYVGNFELPDKNAAAHRVINNAKIFKQIGYEVIFCGVAGEQKENIVYQGKCAGFENWTIKKSDKNLYSIAEIIPIIKKMDDLKAIIAYNYPAISLLRLRSYCKKKNILLIADCTEWYGFLGGNVVYKLIKGMDSFLRMNIIQPRLDGIIAISHYLENYYKCRTKTVFIPPLTDLSEEKWLNTELDTDNILRILYAGTPGKHKDKLNKILAALNDCALSHIQFNIIGITKEQYLEYYPEDLELVDRLSDCVFFKGKKMHLEVIDELKKSDFSLFYRDITRVTTAGFPTKFAESISCGVPVLTNGTSDLEEYLIDGENGFWIDDIDNDLKRVLSMDIHKLKAIKNTVKNDIFDYHNYIDEMKKLF